MAPLLEKKLKENRKVIDQRWSRRNPSGAASDTERISLPTDLGKQASRKLPWLGIHHGTSFPAAVTLSGWAPGVLFP